MRTITIKSGGLGRYNDVSPFLVESRTIELKFNLPNFHGQFFLVTELNGKNLGAIEIPKEGTVKLEGLEAGELKAVVKHYIRGELIETYKVEPLLLKAVDTDLSATPEIAFLTAECEALRKKLEEAEEKLTAAEKWRKETEEREDETESYVGSLIAAFLFFAYADYQTNLQLNAKNLSVEEFVRTLGLELGEILSEDRIECIEKFKEEL